MNKRAFARVLLVLIEHGPDSVDESGIEFWRVVARLVRESLQDVYFVEKIPDRSDYDYDQDWVQEVYLTLSEDLSNE